MAKSSGSWKKGQSGNPTGRIPSLPVEIRNLRKENQAKLISVMNEYIKVDQDTALARISGHKSTQFEDMVQGIIMKAKEGDINCFKFIIETVAGKIPEVDPDEFDEDDIIILKRVKELKEQKKLEKK